MGKQINNYMEYDSFVLLAKKAVELGCEILPFSAEVLKRGALDYDAVRPDYIISRYDSWLLEDGNGQPASLETNTTNNDTASYETTSVSLIRMK